MRTQMLESVSSLENELGYTPGTIEVYVNGVVHMYTGPFYGVPGVGGTFSRGPQPFQGGYDMPASGMQLHLHGPDETTISYGTLKSYDLEVLKELNGFEAAMAAYRASSLGFKKIEG